MNVLNISNKDEEFWFPELTEEQEKAWRTYNLLGCEGYAKYTDKNKNLLKEPDTIIH